MCDCTHLQLTRAQIHTLDSCVNHNIASVTGCVAWAQVEKNKDNILPRIMAISGSYDRLFAEELRKYDPLKAQVPTASAP